MDISGFGDFSNLFAIYAKVFYTLADNLYTEEIYMLVEVVKNEIIRLVEEQDDINWLLDTLELVGGDSVEIVKEYVNGTKTVE